MFLLNERSLVSWFIIITRLDIQKSSVLEDVVLLEDDVSPDLDDILNEPPDNAVGPDEERHELVLVGLGGIREAVRTSLEIRSVPETHGFDIIGSGLGPEGGNASGDEEGSASTVQQDLGGSIGEEGLVASTSGEEGEEVADGNLEVDGGDDLVIVEERKSHRGEP